VLSHPSAKDAEGWGTEILDSRSQRKVDEEGGGVLGVVGRGGCVVHADVEAVCSHFAGEGEVWSGSAHDQAGVLTGHEGEVAAANFKAASGGWSDSGVDGDGGTVQRDHGEVVEIGQVMRAAGLVAEPIHAETDGDPAWARACWLAIFTARPTARPMVR